MSIETGYDLDDFEGRRKNWKVGSEGRDALDIEEYLAEGEAFLYLESEIFDDLMGLTAEELLERTDEAYDTSFSDIDVDGYEYGDGWALFHVEE